MGSEVILNESFEVVNKMNRRLASIDKYYLITVSNKPFNEYFGETSFGCLTEAVAPEDKERLMNFIDSFNGVEKSDFFRFRNYKNELKMNHFKILKGKSGLSDRSIDIEMIDIEAIENANLSLKDDVNKHKMLLGLAREYTFTYNRDTNLFSMYRYDVESREVIFKEEIDEWKRRMLSEGYVGEADRDMFINLVGEIKTYVQTFSVKLNTSMRTGGKIFETLRFIGTVFNKVEGNKIVIGRVIPEGQIHNANQIADMLDELQYDSLTRVYNRKTITDYAVKLLEQNHSRKDRITIAILDVDHFKKVNDTYGHLYGDKVLSRVGRRLKEVVGDDGVVGRIGGDEFVIVLDGINDEHSLRGILRAIRTQIKWEFINDFDDINISCSIGAAYWPTDGDSYEELFRKADYCLYVAKEKGRDRYVFFREDLHKEGYEASLDRKDKAVSNGREMVELRFLTGVMEQFAKDKKKAIEDIFVHMLSGYNINSINIFYGDNLERVYTVGDMLPGNDNALYVKTEGYTKLLDGKSFLASGFVGRQTDVAPEFGNAMERRGILSTIQCIIGSTNNIKGILSIDRCKESAQWAEYEVEMAVITAKLLDTFCENDNPLF